MVERTVKKLFSRQKKSLKINVERRDHGIRVNLGIVRVTGAKRRRSGERFKVC